MLKVLTSEETSQKLTGISKYGFEKFRKRRYLSTYIWECKQSIDFISFMM